MAKTLIRGVYFMNTVKGYTGLSERFEVDG